MENSMRKVLNDEALEKIALTWRRKLGAEHQFVPDIFAILSVLPKYVEGFGAQVVSEGFLRGYEAYTDCTTKKIFVRTSTWKRLEDGEPRARMTIAHEFAHIVLRHSGNRFRQADNTVRRTIKELEANEEFEARRFAGYFLAPTHLVRRFQSQSEICAALRISKDAAEVRSAQISALERLHSPRQLPSSVIDFLEEKRKRGHTIESLSLTLPESGRAPRQEENVKTSQKTTEMHRGTLRTGYLEQPCAGCKNRTLFKDGASCTCGTCGETGPL
jgi:uncharacterized protein DUF955